MSKFTLRFKSVGRILMRCIRTGTFRSATIFFRMIACCASFWSNTATSIPVPRVTVRVPGAVWPVTMHSMFIDGRTGLVVSSMFCDELAGALCWGVVSGWVQAPDQQLTPDLMFHLATGAGPTPYAQLTPMQVAACITCANKVLQADEAPEGQRVPMSYHSYEMGIYVLAPVQPWELLDLSNGRVMN